MHGASIRATRSPDRGRTEGVGSRDPLRPSLLYCADYHPGGQSQWRSGSRRNPNKPYYVLCARANAAAGFEPARHRSCLHSAFGKSTHLCRGNAPSARYVIFDISTAQLYRLHGLHPLPIYALVLRESGDLF